MTSSLQSSLYYLMVFYTDVLHIGAATVGVLFLVARLWDAVADVPGPFH